MVSALTSERMTIDAMLAGADDYISKPFPLREIGCASARCSKKATLRRENAVLQAELNRANARIRELLERFMPAQVMAEFLQRPEPPALGGKRQEITVLYADVRGFTPVAESRPPDELVEILNGCLQLAADAIQAHGGTLDKFMGDGVIVLFNTPVPQPDHAARAVRAAVNIVKAFREGATPERSFEVGIGTNSGRHGSGYIGTWPEPIHTAIGDAMNLAQRLQELAAPSEILIGHRTWELAG